MKKLFLLIWCLVVFFACFGQKKTTLILEGQTKYQIYVDKKSSNADRKAAQIIQEAIVKITGVSIPTVDQHSATPLIVVSSNKQIIGEFLPSFEFSSLKNGGVYISTQDDNLLILGGGESGILNAAYEFIEKFLNCRCYTGDDIYYPTKKSILLTNINYLHNPDFQFRYINYNQAFNGVYPSWHKLTNKAGNPNKYPEDWGLFGHSFFKLIPPSKFFNTNPEYFALVKGKRIATQLCLSNTNVVKIAKDALRIEIAKRPEARFWSVAQEDNNLFCTCENCQQLAKRYDGQSGVIINFINQIAREFPTYEISTLAYNYSRSAPKGIQPVENVNVMLCASGENRAKPYSSNEKTNSLLNDLKGWASLTNNICIWDYVTDYKNFLMPFPNIGVLQSNITLFKKYKVPYTFQQGWVFNGGELNELRCYLIAKLLWDADVNIKEVQLDFLKGYYGPAGTFINQYINEINKDVLTSNVTLTNYDLPNQHVEDFLSIVKIKRYLQLLEKAQNVVPRQSKFSKRVDAVKLTLLYAYLENYYKLGKTTNSPEDLINEMQRISNSLNIDLIGEDRTPTSEFLSKSRKYVENKLVKNKAGNASITSIVPQNALHTDFKILVDGIRGDENNSKQWVKFNDSDGFIIDLGKTIDFSRIETNWLHNPEFNIFLPQNLKIDGSRDGKNYYEICKISNKYAGLGVKREVKPYNYISDKVIKYRYLKISIKIITLRNDQMASHPVMQCDEIIIK